MLITTEDFLYWKHGVVLSDEVLAKYRPEHIEMWKQKGHVKEYVPKVSVQEYEPEIVKVSAPKTFTEKVFSKTKDAKKRK